MKLIFRLLLPILLFQPLLAQEVQWASKVIEFSSEFAYKKMPGQYLAKEALGPPSVLPSIGQNPCAWTPSSEASDQGEFLTLGFEKPQTVRQIVIAENSGAGAIDRVALIDTKGKPHIVYLNPVPSPLEKDGRLWNLFIEPTDYEVRSVRVDLQTATSRSYNQIDAIGISNSTDSVRAQVRLAPNLELAGEPQNLGSAINSSGDELCPVISPDGKTLYFTRMNHPGNIDDASTQDIWTAKLKEDNQFEPATNLGRPLNNAENSSITSISPDGQRALLLNVYNPDGTMDNGISMTYNTRKGWGMPRALKVKDYYNNNKYGEYCLAASGKVMVMTIQREDSEGSKDLYVSFIQPNESWSAPLQMGQVINSAGSETSPFLAADDRTLYFSSEGHPGYGSKDMFVTRRLDDSWTNWTVPENLGPELNTKGWDAYYSIPASGESVYFVSYKEGGYGEADIYRAPLPEALRPDPVVLVRGYVTDKDTEEPLETDISYTNLTTGEEIGIAHSDPKTGFYSIVLPSGNLYGFAAKKKSYLPISDNLDLKELDEYREVQRDLELAPIKVGASIVLKNLYFDTGKFDLRSESFTELKQILEILKEYPNMEVLIAGHTDDVGQDQSNQTLSENRAAAVRSYLTGKGIPTKRINSQGLGEKSPIVPNTSAGNRQLNRRVEFSIVKM